MAENGNYKLNNLGTGRGRTLLYQGASQDFFRISAVGDQVWFNHTFHNQMPCFHTFTKLIVCSVKPATFLVDLKHTQCLEEEFCNTPNKQLSWFNQQIKHMVKSRSYCSCAWRWNLREPGSTGGDNKHKLTRKLPRLQPSPALQFTQGVAEALKGSDRCMAQLLHVVKRNANHLSCLRQELIRKELLY